MPTVGPTTLVDTIFEADAARLAFLPKHHDPNEACSPYNHMSKVHVILWSEERRAVRVAAVCAHSHAQ